MSIKTNDALLIAGVILALNGWFFTGIFIVIASIDVTNHNNEITTE